MGEVDRLEIVAKSTAGPPLNVKQCVSLKWADSPLNTSNADQLAKPVSTIGEIRDGSSLILRSALRAARGPPAEPSKSLSRSSAMPARAKASAFTQARNQTAASRPVVAGGKQYKERSLVIEVAHPEGETAKDALDKI